MMKKENVLSKIEYILLLIENYKQKHPQHINSCTFLKAKYIEFKEAIINDNETKAELIEWNKWFAPRIIFDGINDKEILQEIEKLNILLSRL